MQPSTWRRPERMSAAADERAALAGVARNMGWMVGGKGFQALLSLAYLALVARTLGAEGFGSFALILTIGGTVATLASFNTWQIVVRFGTEPGHAGDSGTIERLVRACGALDSLSAIVGSLLGMAAVLVAGQIFGWSNTICWMAIGFTLAQLLALKSTALGVLRLHDRYDLATGAEAAIPAVRLAGAAIAALTGAGIGGFLAAWAVAELVSSVLHWRYAGRVAGHAVPRFDFAALRGIGGAMPGFWRFAGHVNLATTITAIGTQSAVLMVGAVAGTASAGGYRLARQIGRSLTTATTTLTRAGYPEIMRAGRLGDRRQLVRIVWRYTIWTTGIAAVLMLLAVLLGHYMLLLIGGWEFVGAYPVLILICAAAAVNFCGLMLEPALHAIGRTGSSLGARMATTLVQLGLLALLVPPLGGVGAAWAMLGGAIVSLATLTVSVVRAFRTMAGA